MGFKLMDRIRHSWFLGLLLLSLCPAGLAVEAQRQPAGSDYSDLVALFEDWHAFERPPELDGVPDYTAATTARRHDALKAYQQRLLAIDPKGWPVAQQVYLRQPGYGTSYVTGKFLIERLLAERSRQEGREGRPYGLYEFFAEVDAAGVIPVSLLRWQLTGDDDEIGAMMARP